MNMHDFHPATDECRRCGARRIEIEDRELPMSCPGNVLATMNERGLHHYPRAYRKESR
jgi:hypothetical protein